uniref:Cytoskeleton-associated protein 5 n=1 Tax=Rhabditophanes sp. KR3021 TaxID=114890 RepID=A0AC35UH82_9BILA
MDDQFDLIAKIPSDFEEQIISKKWLERKEALSGLITMASKYDELCPKASYHNLCDTIKLILAKDANINVVAEAGKLLSLLAKGLGPKFKDYGTPFIPVIFEKFKEKKAILKDVLVEAIDLIGIHSPLEQITEDIVAAMEKPNPAQKTQIDLFLSRYLKRFKAATAPKKLIKAVSTVLVKHCGDSDGEVRDASMKCLGCIMFVIGEKDIAKLVGELPNDQIKWGRIQEYKTEISDIVAAEAPPPKPKKAASKKKKAVASESEDDEESEEEEIEEVEVEVDPYTLMEPYDVLSKLPSDFYTNIESKKWTERKDALDGLLKLCMDNPRLCPKSNYGDMVSILKKVLEKDANINVASVAVKCLNSFANGLRQKFGIYVPSLAAGIFDKFKEKKAVLRDPLVELIDSIVVHCVSIDSLQEDICSALAKPNPNIKAQTSLLLQRVFITMNATTLPKKFVKEVSVGLVKITAEADPEARDSACAALGAIMRIIGEKAMNNLLGDVSNDKVKMAKIKELCEKMIEKNGPSVSSMVQSVHKSVPESKKIASKKVPLKKVVKPKKAVTDTEEESDGEPMKPLPKTALSRKADQDNDSGEEKKSGSKKISSKKVVDEEDGPKADEMHLLENSNKNARFNDEAKLKILRWNFEVPQADHLQQLQMLLKDVTSPDLFSKLYNKDFKAQLKGVEVLMTLPNKTAIINNSDLLLKWITLRILETNPTVMLKALELGNFIIECYLEENKQLKDIELNSFMPYLLLKTGETKEPIRNAVKQLVFVVAELTSSAKVYPFLIDALKTKNSRMKAECLTIISEFLDSSYEDISAVPATFTASFKAIAAAISDRDNNVRTCALNCFVSAYKSIGADIYKLAGKLPDKDKGYLDERIKRSGVAMTPKAPQQSRTRITKPVEVPVVARKYDNETMDSASEPYQTNEIVDYKPPNLLSSIPVPGGDYGDIDIDAEFPDLMVSVEATEPFIEYDNGNVQFPVMEDKILPAMIIKSKPQLDQNMYRNEINLIETSLRKVATHDLKIGLDGVKEIFELANDRSRMPVMVMQYKIDELIKILVDTLTFIAEEYYKKGAANEEVDYVTKTVSNAIVCILNQPQIVEFIEIDTIDYFLEVILSLVAQQQVTCVDVWKNSITPSLNQSVVKLCEHCNYNSVMEALARTMTRHTDGQSADKIFSLCRKCMDKLSTLTSKKKDELDAEKCINSLTTIYKLFPDITSKQFETQFHAIKNHIQRLVVVDRAKVKEAIDKNGGRKEKTWLYAGKCVEKSATSGNHELNTIVMELNGMTNDELIKKVSSAPVMSIVWDAFWESGKALDTNILNSVLVNIDKANPYLLDSLNLKIAEAKSILKPGCNKKWKNDVLLKNAVILKGDRLNSLLDRYNQASHNLQSVKLTAGVIRTQSIPPPGWDISDGLN